MGSNVKTDPKDGFALYIPNNSTFEDVMDSLTAHNILKNERSFRLLAEKRKYANNVKAGKYRVKNGMSNWDLINMLRSGAQEPVKVVINNARLKEDVCNQVSEKLAVDSIALCSLLNDNAYLKELGFDRQAVPAMLMANTYEFWWNTDEEAFVKRMKKEYDRFWTEDRLNKARAQNLSPIEAITLASIVEEETKKADEMPIVAGLYLNRLRDGWPLEADPTLKFALGDFSIKRVLNKHKEIDSPYNTYKNTGLPPGPIRIPEQNAIKAVLNPKVHEYMYMCAKDDFSGYHAFARTLAEHNQNATRYRRALNERGIYR